MTLLKIRAIVVSWVVNELVVLKHLLCHVLWQKAHVLLRRNLRIVCLLAGGRFQARPDLLGCVIVLGTEYVLVQCRFAVFENSLDEFAFLRAVSRAYSTIAFGW
jgi:hypothetical protein